MEGTHRRSGDGRIPWARLANYVLLWGAVLTTVGAMAMKYSEILQTVEKVRELEKSAGDFREYRVAHQAESNGRWEEILRRLDRIERKIDRRIQ